MQIREFPGVGLPRLWAGQPAMTFADGIGNLSSRKKSQLTCSMSAHYRICFVSSLMQILTPSSCANILITLFLRVTLHRGLAVVRRGTAETNLAK